MTREEAIANLNMISVAFVEPVTEEQRKLIGDTFDMAIKALEQEPSEEDMTTAYLMGYYANKEPCEDAISRQAVLNTLDNMDKTLDEDRTVENYKELLKECYEILPPVTPQSNTGHWIEDAEQHHVEKTYHCSKCGHRAWGENEKTGYCGGCGAKMFEPQESEG